MRGVINKLDPVVSTIIKENKSIIFVIEIKLKFDKSSLAFPISYPKTVQTLSLIKSKIL